MSENKLPDSESNEPAPGISTESKNDETSCCKEQSVKSVAGTLIESSVNIIANAWRRHRKTREEEGKILSASSRDIILKRNTSCLHLPGQTCPVWSQWEELLNAVEEHLRRKEILEEPPSSNQKLELALCVVERIAKGSSSVKNHLWLILDTEHWLEICDQKHRYGSNLKVYHDYWLKTSTPENFFEWLDNGEGKKLDLKEVRPRELLESQLVKYLTAKERKEHEVTFKDGLLIYNQSGKPVHTNPLPDEPTQTLTTPIIADPPSLEENLNNLEIKENGEPTSTGPIRRGSADGGPKREKWIYVTDCDGNFYVGQKIKGQFHHSSFLAGGAIRAAGGIKAREGKLLEINPNSGHYKPGQDHFTALIERLKGEGIDFSDVKVIYPNDKFEKQLLAKYKIKRLGPLSLVDDLVNDENQKADTNDRQASIFTRNFSGAVTACKNSIREWIQWDS